ncbi:MAG: peroxiredoxin family protein, partial [Planctomycetota bacterium]
EEIKAQGVKLIAVSADSVEDTAGWLAFSRLPFPLLSDPGSTVIREFGVYDRLHDMALPSAVLVDPEGRVVWKYIGDSVVDRPDLDKVLADLRRFKSARS